MKQFLTLIVQESIMDIMKFTREIQKLTLAGYGMLWDAVLNKIDPLHEETPAQVVQSVEAEIEE